MKTYINLTTVLFACYAALTGYYIFTCDTEIDFRLNWNIFNSFLMWPLYILGLVVSFGIKFPEYVPVIKWINPDTGKTEKVEKNDDITETLMASIVIPLLQFFVFVPLITAALIYYPLMGLLWLFGYVFPVFICVFYILTPVMYYNLETKLLNDFKSTYAMPLVAAATVGIIWFFPINWMPDTDKAKLVMDICAGSLIVLSTVLYIVFLRKHRQKSQAVAAVKADTPVEIVEIKKKKPSLTLRSFVLIYFLLFLILFIIIIFFKKEKQTYSSNNSEQNYVTRTAETGKIGYIYSV